MEKPEDFQPRFEVVSIFCEYDERFILLHRNESKPQGNTWGVPAGKVDENENILEAIIRELHQETGILLDKNIIKYFKKVFVRYHKYDFIYHIFHAKLVSPVMLKINKNGSIKLNFLSFNTRLISNKIKKITAENTAVINPT